MYPGVREMGRNKKERAGLMRTKLRLEEREIAGVRREMTNEKDDRPITSISSHNREY